MRYVLFILAATVACAIFVSDTRAQGSAFTYQGRLTDNLVNASGIYQMRFAVYDASTGGAQLGITPDNTGVMVTNGVFTADVDFGAGAFSGDPRFLEVWIRKTSGDTYVVLPRTLINSVPYAVRAAKATDADKLGGVTSASYATKTYVDNAVTTRYGQVSWASPAAHGAGGWSIVGGSNLPLVTTGRPLLITMNITLSNGSHGSCRPTVNGIWAGSFGGYPGNDPFWQEGMVYMGLGAQFARFSLSRIYVNVPAGNNFFQVQCTTDAGTMQSCGTSIGCSFGVIELH